MAQDFDDALSFAKRTDGVTTVYVHIADVSYFVTEGTALDREALRRGNSVYVATGVEPMLPALLSSGVCSLRPDEERKTVTVEMDLDDAGRVLQTPLLSLAHPQRRTPRLRAGGADVPRHRADAPRPGRSPRLG